MNTTVRGSYEDSNWWLAHERGREPHETLIGFVQSMQVKQDTRYDNFRRLQNIYEYGYKAAYSLTGGSTVYSSFGPTQDAPIDEDLLAYNALANVINTIHAKVTKNKITVMPITSGGDYMQQRNAKRLGQCIDGEFEANKFQMVRKGYNLNALNLGTGIVKVFTQWGRVKIEKAAPRDIFVDDGEGRYQDPRSIYQVQYVDRFVLAALSDEAGGSWGGTPESRRAAIMSAPSAADPGGHSVGHDQLQVTEAWHLPSRPIERDEDGVTMDHDGRHSLCIQNCTLIDEPWAWDRFPFAICRPMPREESWWGLSAAHALASGQREFEKFTQNNQLAFERMTGSHIIAPRQANIKARDISNGKGTFFEYDGSIPPVVFNPEAVASQTLQYTASIPDNMMRFMGVSSLSASSQLPAGLQQASGKALQVFDDFESERLVNYHDADEQTVVDTAELVILAVRDLLEDNPEYSVRIQSRDSLEEVKWSDALKDQENFVLRISPISDLVNTPSAKFQQLQERLNAGDITMSDFNSLIEMPDLTSFDEFATADADIIKDMLCRIVYDGSDIQPQPFDDLNMAVSMTRKFINVMRKKKNFPEDRMDKLHNFLLSIQDLQTQANPPAPPPQAMPPQPGAPMMPAPPNGGSPAPMPGPPMPMS